MSKEELIKMVNTALKMEHAARIQYLAHAEKISGLGSESIIARLKEIAGDEDKHEKLWREVLGGYLDAVPTMGMAETHDAEGIEKILEVNLKDEKAAIDYYLQIMEKVKEMKDELKYEFFQIEHSIRHIIMDEQEHVSELKLLLNK